jgi:hypothetical protein
MSKLTCFVCEMQLDLSISFRVASSTTESSLVQLVLSLSSSFSTVRIRKHPESIKKDDDELFLFRASIRKHQQSYEHMNSRGINKLDF